MSNDNRIDHETAVHKLLAQTQHIDIVGDAEVTTHLVLLDINGADDNDDLRHVSKLHQHSQLDVRLETRQYATCMEVVKQLPAKFQIQLIAEFSDALFNMFRLDFKVFFAIEPVFHDAKNLSIRDAKIRYFS